MYPSWTKNASIYEVNIRQYTPEGTFKALKKHLPRLKDMGVDILWLMPIHPIGVVGRKGSLGSYYAVKDYVGVNPEFGSLSDFKSLVNEIHELGMFVIIDWVANHTAWDNDWIYTHPEWYNKDEQGNIKAPIPEWEDVADLNFDNKAMRKAMIEALSYWITECNIDGYRCDMASLVPTNFWEDARKALNKLKKEVFMLAESEDHELHQKAFDMTYGFDIHHTMNAIAKERKHAWDIDDYFWNKLAPFKPDYYLMNFTSSHDENSWNGSEYERMGDAALTMAVLSATVPGMPLIYSGQEDAIDKKIAFFDKDTIAWKTFGLHNFYKRLLHLKKKNKALWNGAYGGSFYKFNTSNNKDIYFFQREKDGEKVLVLLNLSPYPQQIWFHTEACNGTYTDLFLEHEITIDNTYAFHLTPWQFFVLS